MRGSSLGLWTALIFFAVQSAAIAAEDGRCLVRDEREGQGAYAARVHNACDARWRSFRPARPTPGKAYYDYLRRCEKPCAAVIAGAGPTTALLVGGALVAGGAAAAGGKGGGSSPASP